MAKHAFDPARKIELLHMISELHEIGGDNADAAFATYSRAMREDPRNEMTHGQLDRLARGLDKWPEVVALYDQVATEAQEDDLKVALLFRRAQIQEHELARRRRPRSRPTSACSRSSPSTVEAATAIQAIHERTGDWPKLVDIAQAQERASCPTSTSASSCSTAPRRSRRRCSATPTPRSRRSARCCRSTTSTCPRWTPSSGSTSASRGGSRSRTSTPRRPTSPRIRTTRSGCSTCSRRSTTASSATSPRRSRPTRASSISTPTSCPRSSPSTGSTAQAERWYDLLGNLERQVELRRVDRRDRRAQVPHRSPVAAAARRRRARHRELPRGARRSIRRTPRRCRPSTASCTARSSR